MHVQSTEKKMQNSHLLIEVDYLFQLINQVFLFWQTLPQVETMFCSDQIWWLTLIFAEISPFIRDFPVEYPTLATTCKPQNYFPPAIHFQF